jgi:hypothetical protein
MTTVTLAEIDKSLDIVAGLCSEPGGDQFYPLFERLENEREAILARQDTRSRIAARLSAQAAV